MVMYMEASLAAVAWRDRKKYAWPLALLVPALPFAGLAAWRASGGAGWAWWIAPAVVFGVIPAVDLLLGGDRANPPEDAARQLQQLRYYRWLTYLYLPAQYGALVLGSAIWVRGDLGVGGRVGLVLSVGIVNGIAINTAHEL